MARYLPRLHFPLRATILFCSILVVVSSAAQDLGPDGERRWVGEPITLSLKDADLAETLRSFAKVGDFNLILDPAVSGKVTVELKDVPWDQALDSILRIHRLGMDITGGRVVIGPRAGIEARRRSLAEVRTVRLQLRHVPAGAVARAFGTEGVDILSTQGAVNAEPETNTLVLRDRGDRLLRHGKLLTQLDHPSFADSSDAEVVELCHGLWRRMAQGKE